MNKSTRAMILSLTLAASVLVVGPGVAVAGYDLRAELNARRALEKALESAEEFEELSVAAEQGDAYAQYSLGFMYEYGKGVPQDYAAAMKWYSKAADQGHALAQNRLGFMYEYGKGVPQDYAAAVKWYRKAAEQGNAAAQIALGYMYANGKGVPQDYAAVVKWYRKAAEQGNALAQNFLGDMYYNGKGVLQDYVQAHIWFNLAAANGNEAAMELRDNVAKEMTDEEIKEARRLAREYMSKESPWWRKLCPKW